MSERRILCPTCKQDMTCPPREGQSGEACSQCGQGLTIYRADIIAAQQEQEDE